MALFLIPVVLKVLKFSKLQHVSQANEDNTKFYITVCTKGSALLFLPFVSL